MSKEKYKIDIRLGDNSLILTGKTVTISYCNSLDKQLVKAIYQLQQENQQLKEELEDMTLCRDIASGHRKEIQDIELRERRLKEKYKSVLDEIREYIETDSFEINTREYGNITVIDSDNLLQILDKVKE